MNSISVYHLFHGKDAFLSYREAHHAAQELKDQYPDFEYMVIEGDSTPAEQIVNTYETSGLFGVGKVIFLKRANENSENKELIENIQAYLESNPEDTHMILWEASKLASNLRYVKFFQTHDKAITESKDLNKRTFVTWAKEQVKLIGLEMGTDALYSLVQRTNYETERFVNELEKLRLSGEKKITVDMIESSSKDTLETDIWALIDAINGVKELQPMRVLKSLFQQRVDPYYIMSMLNRNTRLLVMAKDLDERGEEYKSIAKVIKVPPFTVGGIVKSARKSSWDKLNLIYDKLYSLDFEIKTGNIDPELGLTLLMKIL